jgi:Rrf2 family cysteine metabolism transcriptional repressor
MWITKKTDYATRAVLALALVHEWGPLKIHEIAERTCVPPSLLEQIMAQLRGAGIVRSVRGPQGGYRLNHPPAEITLARVVRLFAGPLAPIACATRSEPEPCPMEMGCSLLQTWREVRDATIAILERKTSPTSPVAPADRGCYIQSHFHARLAAERTDAHRTDPQWVYRRHRLLVHRHPLRRRELLRAPRLFHRGR